MKPLILLIIYLLAQCLSAQQKNHIEGDVSLNPATSYIKAHLNMALPVNKEKDSLVLFLHRGLKIHSLTGEFVIKYTLNPATNIFGMSEVPFTNTLVVYFENNNFKEQVNFTLEYEGNIKNDEIIFGAGAFHKDWVELSLTSIWFPINLFEQSKFTHHLKVKLPESYQLTGIGQTHFRNGAWEILANTPALDMYLVAAKDLKKHSLKTTQGKTIVLYTSNRNLKSIERIANVSNEVQTYYNKTFAKNSPLSFQKFVYPPNRERNRAEGYSRNPFVMLNHTDIENEDELFKFISHEIAHFWWNKGDSNTTDNFMNESLAEYSYLMALRAFKGTEAFENILQEKREFIKEKETPSLLKIAIHPERNFQMFYYRGCLALNHLEKRIGKTPFQELLIKTLDKKINTLDAFVSLIKHEQGATISKWFYTLL